MVDPTLSSSNSFLVSNPLLVEKSNLSNKSSLLCTWFKNQASERRLKSLYSPLSFFSKMYSMEINASNELLNNGIAASPQHWVISTSTPSIFSIRWRYNANTDKSTSTSPDGDVTQRASAFVE